MTEIGGLQDLNPESTLQQVSRGLCEDLARGIGDEHGALRRKHIGDDVAGRFPRTCWGDQGEVLEAFLEAEPMLGRQNKSAVTGIQEVPPLEAAHPAGIAVDFGSKEAEEPAEGCSEEAGEDVGK